MNTYDIRFLHQLLTITLLYAVMLMLYNPTLKLAKWFFFSCNVAITGSLYFYMQQNGLSFDVELPLWLYARFGVVFLMTFVPLFMVKYLPKLASKLSCVFYGFVAAGIYLEVFKP